MMKYRVSLHNHTTLSDGTDTMEDMILGAISKGFTHFAVTDHCETYEYEDQSLKREKYGEYVDEIMRLREKYAARIEIHAGIESERYGELGYLNAGIEDIRKRLDYVVGSVHDTGRNGNVEVVDAEMILFRKGLKRTYGGHARAFVEDYFKNYIANINELKPEIAGHIDLVKKNNVAGCFFDENSSWYMDLVGDALDAVKKNDCVLEINTGGAFKHGARCIYPSPEIIRMAVDKNIKMTMSSDAHSVDMIGYLYGVALYRLKKEGIRKLYTYSLKNGEFVPFDID